MAQLSLYKGPQASLPSSYREGALYVTTDKPSLYFDISGTQRIKISDITVVQNFADLPKDGTSVTTTLYYVNADNALYTWSQQMTGMVKINLDTGATGVKIDDVLNTGNAITNIKYDEGSRSLIFEKGLAFAEDAKVGNLTELATSNKDSIVKAINEINAAVVAGSTGIKKLYINDSGELICVLTDETEINAGQISVPQNVLDQINKKVDKVEGASLISDALITKVEGLANIKTVAANELVVSEQGELSVGTIPQSKIDGLPAALEATIKGIKAGEVDLVPASGVVTIPAATAEALGLVKSSTNENTVSVGIDGVMTVNNINVNKLSQTAGEDLILYCGTSILGGN
jgi:hypothetical protein